MKRFSVVTLFPELIEAYRVVGVIGRAWRSGIVDIEAVNPRAYTSDRRSTVDDASYGGGPGMVMMVAPLRAAIAALKAQYDAPSHVIYLSPQGRRFEQSAVNELKTYAHLILVAGRYEGIDERLLKRDIDSEWSVGDFVVSGGEVPAMIVIDAVTRTLAGALGDERSADEDSFSDDLLDFPHYTRPETVALDTVPAVLLSGDHAAIKRWRRKQRLGRTHVRRPDLLARVSLTAGDRLLIDEYLSERDRDDDA